MTYPFVASPNYRHPRRGRITWIVLHITESDIRGTPDPGAERTAKYFQTPNLGVSSHYVTDDDSTIQCVAEGDEAWTNAPWNPYSIAIEQEGMAEWDRPNWMGPHDGLLNQTAVLLADLNRRYGIPLRRLVAGDIAPMVSAGNVGPLGVTTHSDLNKAARSVGKQWFQARGFLSSTYSDAAFFDLTSHTDCGNGYPIDVVLTRAQALTSAPIDLEEDMAAFTMRPRGYANQFVICPAGVLVGSAELLAKMGIGVNDATVFTHRATLISYMSQAGISRNEMVLAGEAMPPEHQL